MRVFIGALLCGTACATSAWAQDWSATQGDGVLNATVTNGTANLVVTCAPANGAAFNAVQVTIGDATIAGPVTFAFDGDTTVAGIFGDGFLTADTPQNAAIFGLLRDALKSKNVVTVTARNAPPQTFSLRGSSRAIGTCDVPVPAAQEEPAAPAEDTTAPVTPDQPNPTEPAYTVEMETVQPLADDPFVDHRLADCSGTRGVLLMNYDTLNGITELSDFCLDDTAGTMAASEPRAGFAATAKDDQTSAFEILETGSDQFSRVRVELGPALGCIAESGASAVTYAIPDGNLSRNPETLFLYARGLTVDDAALAPRNLFESESTLLSIRDFSVRRIDPATTETNLLPAGADLRGVLAATVRSASLAITGGNGFWVGDANGSLQLTVEDDGDVIGSGRFSAKNQKLVGQAPTDWVTMTAEIPYLRGYVLGEEGSAVIAYGIVRGSYVDARDRTHSFEASATFTACATD